jgi:hypothetical protein
VSIGVRTLLGGRGGLLLVALVAMQLTVAIAKSAEVTRESYRTMAEPLCRRNTQANERIFADVRSEVREDKLRLAAYHFGRAAHALERTVDQLAALPRPSTDRGRLKDWFSYLKIQVRLFERIAADLEAGEKLQAQRLVIRLTSNAARANAKVVEFEFKFCRLEPSLPVNVRELPVNVRV